MILGDFLKALGQLGDPRFLRVLLIGLALTLLLLFALYAGFLGVIDLFIPAHVSIPFVGQVDGLGALLGLASLALMVVLSVFLMVPVAAAFTAFFLDDVAQAVEDRYFPGLPPALPSRFADTVIDTLFFLVTLLVVNGLSLLLWSTVGLFTGPLVPMLFWAINGYLLGREYFTLVASRRVGRVAARQMRRMVWGQVWIAGILMAAPLSLPLVNLLVPVLGAATFTHLFHRISDRGQSRLRSI